MKNKVIILFIISFLLIFECKAQSFRHIYKKYVTDTVDLQTNRINIVRQKGLKIFSLEIIKFNDSIIKSKEIQITNSYKRWYQSYRKVIYYETGIVMVDTSFKKKIRKIQKLKKKEFYENGEKKYQIKATFVKVKGFGIGEAYSWGLDKYVKEKRFDKGGKLLYKSKKRIIYPLKNFKFD